MELSLLLKNVKHGLIRLLLLLHYEHIAKLSEDKTCIMKD